MNNNLNQTTSNILLENRNKLKITGVSKVLELNSKESLIETTLGKIIIKGNNIEMISFNDKDLSLYLHGNFDFFGYTNQKTKEKGFFNKLLK